MIESGTDVEGVRWLLSHLDDSAALANSPLLAQVTPLAETDPYAAAHSVRTLLLDCIESLRPARRLGRRSDEARAYNALWLRYVEGMGVLQVGEELALSERQTHRELRAAEARLAEVLASRLREAAMPLARNLASEPGVDAVVTARPDEADLRALAQDAVGTVAPLADSAGVTVRLDAARAIGTVLADAGILRQWIIQGLSLAVQAADTAEVHLAAESTSGAGSVCISFVATSTMQGHEALGGLDRLASTLRADFSITHDNDEQVRLHLTLPSRRVRSVLVIEDSAAAVELYRRYLEPLGDWTVVAAADPQMCYELARTTKPAIILLDLLMPGTDGWTILNLLHAGEDTADIPVIVCSVFHDALLAEALGAKAHLRKPVSQAELLAALSRWAR